MCCGAFLTDTDNAITSCSFPISPFQKTSSCIFTVIKGETGQATCLEQFMADRRTYPLCGVLYCLTRLALSCRVLADSRPGSGALLLLPSSSSSSAVSVKTRLAFLHFLSHTSTHTHADKHNTQRDIYTHTCTHICTHTCTCTQTHKHTHACTLTHTHTHFTTPHIKQVQSTQTY